MPHPDAFQILHLLITQFVEIGFTLLAGAESTQNSRARLAGHPIIRTLFPDLNVAIFMAMGASEFHGFGFGFGNIFSQHLPQV